jgi:endonuclease G, mitochondrial
MTRVLFLAARARIRRSGACMRLCLPVLLLAVWTLPVGGQTERSTAEQWRRHILLGIPVDDSDADDVPVRRPQYVLSYNPILNAANWVSWECSAAWYGDVPRRRGAFLTDPLLPAGLRRVRDRDYSGSGFDRGHMVRSEERTRTAEDNRSTFYLTNVLPQHPALNRVTWLALEYWCERQCKDHDRMLCVIAGGVFHGPLRRIGGTHTGDGVAVPDSCFKIIVVLNPGEGPGDVDATTPVIAVMMPNDATAAGESWTHYLTTVDLIEDSTGYDFLSAVSEDIQDIIEARPYTPRNGETP